MQSPLLSIGMSCYNVRGTVMDSLRSIFTQAQGDWELILVDDGATDGTGDILRQVSDPRVRLIQDGEHRGLAGRLNQIASFANGEFLARMDADDLMMPDRLERQVRILERNPECIITGSAMVCIDQDSQPLRIRIAPAVIDSPTNVLRGTPVFHPTVLGRTEWFREHPYDETCSVTQDFDLWARNAGNLIIHNLPDPLLFYREYDGYTWSKYRRQSRATRQIIRREGPALVGRLQTARLLAIRAAKDTVYAALAAAGCWKLALHLRNRPISNKDAGHYRSVITAIQQQHLPGIE